MVSPRRPGWGRRGGVMGSAPGREAGQRRGVKRVSAGA